jgi:hypothetical protein
MRWITQTQGQNLVEGLDSRYRHWHWWKWGRFCEVRLIMIRFGVDHALPNLERLGFVHGSTAFMSLSIDRVGPGVQSNTSSYSNHSMSC